MTRSERIVLISTVVGTVTTVLALFVSAPGSWYTYLSYESSVRAEKEKADKEKADAEREAAKRAELAARSTAVKTDPLPKKSAPPMQGRTGSDPHPSTPAGNVAEGGPAVRDVPTAAQTDVPPGASVKPQADPLKQVSLAPLPMPLGSQTSPKPTDPPKESAKSEPRPGALRIVTAIEGEAFPLCGQPDFTISFWTPRPNAPAEASLRRHGMMLADGLSLQLVRGKARTIVENCDVTFVEVRPGFKPVAVLEERRKDN